MTLDQKRVAAATIQQTLGRWPRIIAASHARTPADTGYGSSRFSSPSRAFKALYAAEDFGTSFAEAVVRDRFVGRQRRYLYRETLENLMITEIGSRADLALLDLTGGAAYELGIDTDAKGARAHTAGQELAEELHATTMVDGILFDSRLRDRRCVAIFDRAFSRLVASTPIPLVSVAALPGEITRLEIVLRRKRAY